MGMTDAALVKRATEYKRIKAQIDALEAEAHRLSAAMVAELDARQAKSLALDGVTITHKASTRTTYRLDDLRPLVPKSVLTRITRTVVDPAAVALEIAAGRLADEVVAPARDTKVGAAYVTVTLPAVAA